MEFNDYQDFVRTTKIYPDNMEVVYPCLGLSGETGEVCDKIKKIFRDKNGIFSEEDKEEIFKELGDVLWYIAAIAIDLGVDLDYVAIMNHNKVIKRFETKSVHGNGDNR